MDIPGTCIKIKVQFDEDVMHRPFNSGDAKELINTVTTMFAEYFSGSDIQIRSLEQLVKKSLAILKHENLMFADDTVEQIYAEYARLRGTVTAFEQVDELCRSAIDVLPNEPTEMFQQWKSVFDYEIDALYTNRAKITKARVDLQKLLNEEHHRLNAVKSLVETGLLMRKSHEKL
jgi:hypothetical protein